MVLFVLFAGGVSVKPGELYTETIRLGKILRAKGFCGRLAVQGAWLPSRRAMTDDDGGLKPSVYGLVAASSLSRLLYLQSPLCGWANLKAQS
jgi:hypothetical protein